MFFIAYIFFNLFEDLFIWKRFSTVQSDIKFCYVFWEKMGGAMTSLQVSESLSENETYWTIFLLNIRKFIKII